MVTNISGRGGELVLQPSKSSTCAICADQDIVYAIILHLDDCRSRESVTSVTISRFVSDAEIKRYRQKKFMIDTSRMIFWANRRKVLGSVF